MVRVGCRRQGEGGEREGAGKAQKRVRERPRQREGKAEGRASEDEAEPALR